MTSAQDSIFARLTLLDEHPGTAALIRCAGARAAQTITAAQLLDGCRRTADMLRAAGVRRGDKAVVMTRDAHELFVAVHGLAALGAVPDVDLTTLPGPQQDADREALLRGRAARRPALSARVLRTRRQMRTTRIGRVLRSARRAVRANR